MPTQAEWRAVIERQLPPPERFCDRNQAITAAYASWYRQEPWLFKWAGMAAFASDQVGVAVATAEMLMAPRQALREDSIPPPGTALPALLRDLHSRGVSVALFVPIALHEGATAQLLEDLRVIKQANDAIFNDTGWAHLAYIHGGLEALEACLTADEERPLLDAFRMLDEGAHRVCDPSTLEEGRALIDQAAVAMLRHEQMTILPPYMERLSDPGRRLASLGTWLDFEGLSGLMGQPWFSGYFGLPAVLLGTRSIANTQDRWTWIENDLLPRWFALSAAYREGCPVDRRLAAFAERRLTALQRTAGAMKAVYRAIALQ
ncbi:MAG: hypothetical protein RMK84_17645 [Oscillochloridaceae bacterium]|nr:hypothetical protein [Chloroflexaceae bacterium]MDW8391948.1 hypothetical protein [Oscillochloridaceae bacterium]